MDARDALLGTKLHVPRPPADFVPRPRLTALLEEGLTRPLTVVCAPAGSGKTSLLAAWASGGRRPVAWLSLDEGDNDPARFWRHVAAALDRTCPGIGGRAGALITSPPPRSFDGVVTCLINELAARPSAVPALLVLDDYHLVAAEQVHAALGFLVDHLPPGLHLVLSTRSDPPLRLSRLRARAGLSEVRTADLRFTADEAGALLCSATPRLGGGAVTALTERTEGWAAGLKLAGLSLRGHDDVEAFIASFTGSHRYVLDYLAEEVLDRQDAQTRAFLLETSVLESLCGDLCDAVTGRPGGQAMLERIERAGLFLVPLDEVRGWWRYHQLFASLLQARLQAGQPGRMAALHRAAAAWHAERGLPRQAIQHALAAEDREQAADLIENVFDSMYFTSENVTLRRWFGALPAELVGRRPRLSLALAFMSLAAGDPTVARAAIESAGTDTGAARDSFRSSVGPAASMITNVAAADAVARGWLAGLVGDADQMSRSAAQARALLRDSEWQLGAVCRLITVLADWLGGRLGDAEQNLLADIARWRAAGQPSRCAQALRYLGRIRQARGDLAAAASAYGDLLRIVAPAGGPASPLAGMAHVGLAEVLYQRGNLAAARRELDEGLPLCRQVGHAEVLAAGLVSLAWIRQAEGDQAGAREAMAEALRAGPSPAVTSLLYPVPAEHARLLLAQGDTAAAAAWTRQRGLRPDDDPPYPAERDSLVLARVLIAQDRPEPASILLGRLLRTAQAQGRAGSIVEIRALRALALARSAAPRAAVAELAAALTLVGPHEYVRVFADEGPPMANLVSMVRQAQRDGQPEAARVPLGTLAGVLRACTPPDADRAAASPLPGLIEPLTAREAQILELLAGGATNQRIADELVVTLGTVKKHLTHVLGKLGAANRTEAVACARQLGLIDI